MNAPTLTNQAAEELHTIERALDALLTAALKAKPLSREDDGRPRHIGELLDDLLSQTKAQRAAAELLDNPVGEMARQGVRILGERIHELGGLGLMDAVLQRLCRKDDDPRRETIMDRRWDGIGRTETSSGWCA